MLLVANLAVPWGLPTARALAEEKEGPDGIEELSRTIQTMRDVGNAMYSWFVDHHGDLRVPDGPRTTVDVTALPPISKEELESLLVPDYLTELPVADGWGRPLEFRLARAPRGENMMALRSAGPDGEFSSSAYELGSFDKRDPTADVVWIDGFFGRWPE